MIVADTNLIAYVLISSDQTDAAAQSLAKDADWRVPPNWRSEFRQVLVRYVRAQRLTLEQARFAMRAAEELIAGEQKVDSMTVLNKAIDSGCSSYDCEFVVLAEDLGIPLVTADAKVLRAFPGLAMSPEQFIS